MIVTPAVPVGAILLATPAPRLITPKDTMSDLLDLYQTVILEHSRHPHHHGPLTGPDVRTAEGDNPLCGDRVKLFVRAANDRIVDVSFEGDGCAISIASASMLCDAVIGRSFGEAEALFTQVHGLIMGDGDGDGNGDGDDDRNVAGTDIGTADDDLFSLAADVGPLAALSGVRRFPMRVKCATLAWHTLKSVLAAGWIVALIVGTAACAPRPSDGQAAGGTAASDTADPAPLAPTRSLDAPGAAPTPDSAAGAATVLTHTTASTTTGSTDPSNSTMPAALPTVADHGEPQAVAEIFAAQLQLADADAFRIRQTTQTINQTFPMTLTYVAPDRYSMVAPGMHAARIGDKGYFNLGGEWHPDDTVVATLQATFDPLRNPAVVANAARSMAEARVLGTSTVNGVPAKHYSYVVAAASGGTAFTSTFEIWIGAENGRILVQQVDNEASGITSRSQQVFDYGPGLTVDGP